MNKFNLIYVSLKWIMHVIHDRAAVALMAKTKMACFLSFNLLVPGVH